MSKFLTVVLSVVVLSADAALLPADVVVENGRDELVFEIVREVRTAPAPAPPNADIKPDDADTPDAPDAPDTPDADAPPAVVPPVPVDPDAVIMHLRDGSTVHGKLHITELIVDTQFGRLTIPVANVVSFRPGLDSVPGVFQQINELIDALGADDFNAREEAQKELIARGSPIRRVLEERMNADDNAERIRRIKLILEKLDELNDEEDWGEDKKQEWIMQDTVVTSDFPIVGTIVQKQFNIRSKFGVLTVALADVRLLEKQKVGREEVRKTVAVEGSHVAQMQFKNTVIRVNAGDHVRLTADGSVTMTPWGTNAVVNPEGNTNYGWYVNNQIPAGALVGRIGDAGEVFKVGSKLSFTAKKSGTLQLAIGMNPSYANQAYPGRFNVKVQVTPK